MRKIVPVRFKKTSRVYYFNPAGQEVKRGTNVIVETARGMEYGTVVSDVKEVSYEEFNKTLKPIIRLAGGADAKKVEENTKDAEKAFAICKEKIKKHELRMKLIGAEYTFDKGKLLFYFTAEGRVDFRELVKDLASEFRTRIELRQVGVRDETRIMGGVGYCGRILCCHAHLSDFNPVSIKMAKDQNLSLNPSKISGVCGRLMCCLKHEESTYEELNRHLPNVGDKVTTADGLHGEVRSVNILRGLVTVVLTKKDEKEIKEYEASTLKFKKSHAKKERENLSKEELEELKRLEREDQKELAKAEEEDA